MYHNLSIWCPRQDYLMTMLKNHIVQPQWKIYRSRLLMDEQLVWLFLSASRTVETKDNTILWPCWKFTSFNVYKELNIPTLEEWIVDLSNYSELRRGLLKLKTAHTYNHDMKINIVQLLWRFYRSRLAKNGHWLLFFLYTCVEDF